MTKKGNGKSGPLRLYKSYIFKTKDPVIDELRTLLTRGSGRNSLDNKILAQIERDGGPSVGAMRGWFFEDTLRPQSATVEAAGRAAGFKRVWVKDR